MIPLFLSIVIYNEKNKIKKQDKAVVFNKITQALCRVPYA